MRRSLVLALAAAALAAVALPGSASAHSGATRGTDYRTVVRIVPDGVGARIVGGDDRLVLTRTGTATVVVEGYQGEPYLRLDGDGVWRNRRSPATILNSVRLPTLEEVQRAQAGAHGTPSWERLGRGRTVVYHDHRTHWMGSSPPPAVQADRSTGRKVLEWSVPLVVGGTPRAMRGSLLYVPPPDAPWWPVVLLAVSLGLAAGVLAGRRWGLCVAWSAGCVAILSSVLVSAAAVLPLPGGSGRLVVPVLLPAVAGALVLVVAARISPAPAVLLLLVTCLAIAADPLAGRAAASFDHGVVPSELSATAVRGLVVAGLAATAVVAGTLVPLGFGRRSGGSAAMVTPSD